jgi:hypothetical protein
MNKKAAKTLKAASKNYKKKVRQPVTVELQEEHLDVVVRALETYQRLKLGQIKHALDEAFDTPIDYEDAMAIENFTRKILFPELSPNASYGIYNTEKVGDATLAYELYKVLGRYKAFKDNDGWADYTRRFDKPHSHTGVPLPVVQGAIEHKNFKIPKKLWKKIANAIENKDTADWSDIWKSIDKAMPKLPRGEKSEIICSDFISDGYYIKVTAPIKPKEMEK